LSGHAAALQPMAGVGVMEEGPKAPDSYAANGWVVGLEHPEVLKKRPHLPSLYGCESTDAACAAESR
jgi:hypothetical protein